MYEIIFELASRDEPVTVRCCGCGVAWLFDSEAGHTCIDQGTDDELPASNE